ncbi:hypothetical protein [Phytoactinopolyspora mesophila]|uniref:DUF2029 domain-containing protein n=1 Tax=Phytoactinopolyspora mesophila TaxID=2650750 RepID=A0A7K3M6X4_9ACTN|nr:hypothetical protein [Phytoactinopolyspora mesophila]NDL58158.1 hypothetical protein [Phytoactinopolyspora mesophila]
MNESARRIEAPDSERTHQPDGSGFGVCFRPTRLTLLVLVAWVVLLVGVRLLGLHVVATRDADLKLRAIPLYGDWQWGISWWLLAPIVAGSVFIAVLPPLVQRWSWRGVLAATAAAGVVFSLALALAETHPTVWSDIHHTYAGHIGFIDDAGGVEPFLREYAESQLIPAYPVHLRSHPPGLLLFFWWAAEAGVSGVVFQNVVAMAGAAAMIVAALAILRDVASERTARAAAPFLVVVPAAVWQTNADIIFAGAGLAAVACLILATGRSGRETVAFTVAGGLLAGIALMLSFGIALLAIPVVVIAVWRKRWWVLVGGGALAAVVVALPLVWGYWWVEGLGATRVRYFDGVASARGYWYFLIANPAVYALALGPAIVVALSRLRDRRVWLVVGAGLAVVAMANLSGLSSGETERIWQPFMPLVLLAGCALDRTSGASCGSSAGGPALQDAADRRALGEVRGWLTLQLVVTVALVAALRVPW